MFSAELGLPCARSGRCRWGLAPTSPLVPRCHSACPPSVMPCLAWCTPSLCTHAWDFSAQRAALRPRAVAAKHQQSTLPNVTNKKIKTGNFYSETRRCSQNGKQGSAGGPEEGGEAGGLGDQSSSDRGFLLDSAVKMNQIQPLLLEF